MKMHFLFSSKFVFLLKPWCTSVVHPLKRGPHANYTLYYIYLYHHTIYYVSFSISKFLRIMALLGCSLICLLHFSNGLTKHVVLDICPQTISFSCGLL